MDRLESRFAFLQEGSDALPVLGPIGITIGVCYYFCSILCPWDGHSSLILF